MVTNPSRPTRKSISAMPADVLAWTTVSRITPVRPSSNSSVYLRSVATGRYVEAEGAGADGGGEC